MCRPNYLLDRAAMNGPLSLVTKIINVNVTGGYLSKHSLSQVFITSVSCFCYVHCQIDELTDDVVKFSRLHSYCIVSRETSD